MQVFTRELCFLTRSVYLIVNEVFTFELYSFNTFC